VVLEHAMRLENETANYSFTSDDEEQGQRLLKARRRIGVYFCLLTFLVGCSMLFTFTTLQLYMQFEPNSSNLRRVDYTLSAEKPASPTQMLHSRENIIYYANQGSPRARDGRLSTSDGEEAIQNQEQSMPDIPEKQQVRDNNPPLPDTRDQQLYKLYSKNIKYNNAEDGNSRIHLKNRFMSERESRKTKIGEDDDNFDGIEWPSEWVSSHGKKALEDNAKEAVKWKLLTRDMMHHAWAGYARVWGADSVKPKTGTAGKMWANCALTMIDTLDTLWLMDMRDEFNNATEYVGRHLEFEHDKPVSVFEMTIRGLGGLLSAYALSGNNIFRTKAMELGDKLLPAFKHGIPFAQVVFKTGRVSMGLFKGTALAEAGTVQLELSYLSKITNDPKYKAAGDKAMDILLSMGGKDGLLPIFLSLPSQAIKGIKTNGRRRDHVSFGAMGDSYFEYLLKLWIFEGKEANHLRDAWVKSMEQAVQEGMFKRYNEDGMEATAILELDTKTHKLYNKQDHLACFMGGMLMLGERTNATITSSGFFQWGKEITNGCYGMYKKTPSNLAPEIFRFNEQEQTLKADLRAKHYLLRPETAESIFYLFYYTGDPQYRRWAGFILEAIEKHCKMNYGYSSIKDTMAKNPVQNDEMESFFLAETLKYLYLTFLPNPRTLVDLDKYVFNTEAHIFPIQRSSSSGSNSDEEVLG